MDYCLIPAGPYISTAGNSHPTNKRKTPLLAQLCFIIQIAHQSETHHCVYGLELSALIFFFFLPKNNLVV